MAGLGWIHFSNTTRQKVLKVIDLLGEKGAIDELGIGVVRNAFSNEMFTGISTIMSRARYYYIVPYLIIDYLRDKQRDPIDVYMNKRETEIMMQLTRKYLDSADKEKIIGYTIAKKNIETQSKNELVRKPSEIYWGGIRAYNLFKKPHSFAQLCDAINQGKYNSKTKDNTGSEDEKGDDASDYEKWEEIFDVPYTTDWQDDQIELRKSEALHLKEKINAANPESLLTAILQNDAAIIEFLKLKKFKDIINNEFYQKLSNHNQKVVKTAIQFWEVLLGAHIRLNILIQKRDQQVNQVSFEEKWQEYEQTMSSFDWEDFDRTFLWQITEKYSKVNGITHNFITKWIEGIQSGRPITDLDELVKHQEKRNKEDRSKFDPNNQSSYNDWVGIQNLDFRLTNVQTIVKDIYRGINTTDHA